MLAGEGVPENQSAAHEGLYSLTPLITLDRRPNGAGALSRHAWLGAFTGTEPGYHVVSVHLDGERAETRCSAITALDMPVVTRATISPAIGQLTEQPAGRHSSTRARDRAASGTW
jgi:hypothetical protein